MFGRWRWLGSKGVVVGGLRQEGEGEILTVASPQALAEV